MSNPTILWAQDRDTVFVTIQVEEIKEHDIKINNNKITFKGKNNTNQYNLEINLFTDINIEKSNSAIYATDIKLKLRKNHSLFWPRLTKTKQNNIKIDWSKWVCEDDEDESDDNINPLLGGHSFEDFKKQIPNEILEKDFSELFGNNNEEISDNDEDHSLSGNDASGEYSISENSISENSLNENNIKGKLKMKESNKDLNIHDLDMKELDNEMNEKIGNIDANISGLIINEENIEVKNLELSDDIEDLENDMSQ